MFLFLSSLFFRTTKGDNNVNLCSLVYIRDPACVLILRLMYTRLTRLKPCVFKVLWCFVVRPSDYVTHTRPLNTTGGFQMCGQLVRNTSNTLWPLVTFRAICARLCWLIRSPTFNWLMSPAMMILALGLDERICLQPSDRWSDNSTSAYAGFGGW